MAPAGATGQPPPAGQEQAAALPRGRGPAAELDGGRGSEGARGPRRPGPRRPRQRRPSQADSVRRGSGEGPARRPGRRAGWGSRRRGPTHRAGPCSGGSGGGRSQAFKMAAARPQHRYRRRRNPRTGTLLSGSRPLPTSGAGAGGSAKRQRRPQRGQPGDGGAEKAARTIFLGGSTRDTGFAKRDASAPWQSVMTSRAGRSPAASALPW